MITAEQMMEIMYQNMLPALPHIPGTAPTVAQYRVMLLLIHLHLSDEESDPLYAQTLMEILSGGWDDLDEGKLAKAFCGSLELNMGNRYAGRVVAEVLNDYNGAEVSAPVSRLLLMLESQLVSSGAGRKRDTEDGE